MLNSKYYLFAINSKMQNIYIVCYLFSICICVESLLYILYLVKSKTIAIKYTDQSMLAN